MATPNELVVRLSAVTPIFIGGAEPNEYAELRPPSIKGLLRYWYRAIDGEYRKIDGSGKNGGARVPTKEERLFGSTRGQSPCLVRVGEWTRGNWTLDLERRKHLAYVGHFLEPDESKRKAIRHDTRFTLFVRPRSECDGTDLRRAWLTSLWLLVHVGGLGSRSRRGFGSIRIDGWSGWPECEDLPLACGASSQEEWRKRVRDGFAQVRIWYPGTPKHDHTIIHGGRTQAVWLKKQHANWQDALAAASRELLSFRRRHLKHDGARVKAHLKTRQALETAPKNAAFGLPVTFKFLSLEIPNEITFKGRDRDRMASPLFLRIVRIGNEYFPVFFLLSAPLLPGREPLIAQVGKEIRPPMPWPPAAQDVVQRFLRELKGRNGRDAEEVIL